MLTKSTQLEYVRWLDNTTGDILNELKDMDEAAIEDAFYCDLVFGTGGLRGIMGAGTNRMNEYIVAKASQGLANYLLKKRSPSVVIGYDSRVRSDVFAKVAAGVFAANEISVYIWPECLPVPMVSYAIRKLGCSAGIMITASHNPSNYNGYKVYNSAGCQITIEATKAILNEINAIDIFADVKTMSFDAALVEKKVQYITSDIQVDYISAVKEQSVLFGDKINKDFAIIYSPLNGTGLKPVMRVLRESGFKNITVVEEQRNPNGFFPTCPYPNPEIPETMELGLKYCELTGAELLIVTDPDCDRCSIAVKAGSEYKLLSGNEVGVLLLDFICSQRSKHSLMPKRPVFAKTIVTTDLAERVAENYGVETVNVLTGFKYIGETIGTLDANGRASDYIYGFEESCGYLSGSYVRDKDAVNAALMICEMFAFYKSKGISLLDKLNELYAVYGYCLNTLYAYEFLGKGGKIKMDAIMCSFRGGIDAIGGEKIVCKEDYLLGLNNLPSSNVLKLFFEGEKESGAMVIRPSGTEPKLKVYIGITATDREVAKITEAAIRADIEKRLA